MEFLSGPAKDCSDCLQQLDAEVLAFATVSHAEMLMCGSVQALYVLGCAPAKPVHVSSDVPAAWNAAEACRAVAGRVPVHSMSYVCQALAKPELRAAALAAEVLWAGSFGAQHAQHSSTNLDGYFPGLLRGMSPPTGRYAAALAFLSKRLSAVSNWLLLESVILYLLIGRRQLIGRTGCGSCGSSVCQQGHLCRKIVTIAHEVP
jgi:hypothetical protein